MRGLQCSRCSCLLNIPVMLDQQFKNVCLKCYKITVGVYNNQSRNFPLEALILQAKFPCTFRQYGCDFYVPYQNLNAHIKYCPYKRKPCPYYINCPWFGSVKNLPKHFEDEHNTCLIKSNQGLDFIVYLKIVKNMRVNFLLVCSHGQFLLQFCKENNIIYYNLCFVGRSRKYGYLKYKVEELFYKEEFKLTTTDKPAEIDSELKIGHFNKNHALAISLDSVFNKITKAGEAYMILRLYNFSRI